MAQIKLRIELNKGRTGAPLEKLGTVARQMERFLRAVAADLNIDARPGEWLAVNFKNGSVAWDASFQEEVSEAQVRRFNDSIEFITDYDPETEGTNGIVTDLTLLEYSKIGDCIDPDEVIGVTALISGSADAVTFGSFPIDNNDNSRIIVSMTGKIELGDYAKFINVVKNLPENTVVVGFLLNSPGGNIAEALRITEALGGQHVETMVAPDSKCASACFLIFAAGELKVASNRSFIGVHSLTTINFGEDESAKSNTVDVARYCSTELNIPRISSVRWCRHQRARSPNSSNCLGRSVVSGRNRSVCEC
jgi:hypothetical protein